MSLSPSAASAAGIKTSRKPKAKNPNRSWSILLLRVHRFPPENRSNRPVPSRTFRNHHASSLIESCELQTRSKAMTKHNFALMGSALAALLCTAGLAKAQDYYAPYERVYDTG